MADILQPTFPNLFASIKIVVFGFPFQLAFFSNGLIKSKPAIWGERLGLL